MTTFPLNVSLTVTFVTLRELLRLITPVLTADAFKFVTVRFCASVMLFVTTVSALNVPLKFPLTPIMFVVYVFPLMLILGPLKPFVTVNPTVVILLVFIKLVTVKLVADNRLDTSELTMRELEAMMHPDRLTLLPVNCPVTVKVGRTIPLVIVMPFATILLALMRLLTVMLVTQELIEVRLVVMRQPDKLILLPVYCPFTVKDDKVNPLVTVSPVVIKLLVLMRFVTVRLVALEFTTCEFVAIRHPDRLMLLPVNCPVTVKVGRVKPFVTVNPVVIILLELMTLVTLKLVALS